MAKKRSWFTLVKRFFRLEKQTKPEKERRRKWVFEGLQVKRLPPIAAPPPPKAADEAEEQVQSKHALSVALAAAAAAEAAAAAASAAAAEVAKLTDNTQPSSHQRKKEVDAPSVAITHQDTTHISRQNERKCQEFAAIRLQAAFRGYLARKALRALKGIVRLQAIIRGRAIRRHAMTTLKRLQSIVDIHSQVCATRSHIVQMHCDENCQIKHIRYKVDKNSQRRWDDSLLSKKDAEALFLSKKEAALRRERMKGYSFNPRKSAESEHGKPSGRWRYWLEQWVDTQLAKSKEFEDLEPVLTSHPKPNDEDKKRQFKQKNSPKKQQFEPLDSPQSAPRSYLRHKRQCSMGDDNFQSSPAIPAYMATTESAKAKARSLSSPKLRPGAFDVYSDSCSPYKNKLSLVSSIASEVPSFCRSGKPNDYQQKSPSLKGIPPTVKPSRNIARELSID